MLSPQKKASGVDNCDLGEVEEVQDEFIDTEKGVIKKRYYLPKILIAGYDGQTLYFRIMKAESKRYHHRQYKTPKNHKKN